MRIKEILSSAKPWDSDMRIIIIGPAYPLRGGIAHFAALLYKKLTRKKHQVKLISFKRQYPSLFFPGKTQYDEGKPLIKAPSLPLIDSINPVSWFRTIFYIRAYQPDLVIFQYWMPFFALCYTTILLGAKFLNIPVFYICHNIIPHEKKFGDRFLTHIAFRFVNAFIVQSKAVLEDLLEVRKKALYQMVYHPIYTIFPAGTDKTAAQKKLHIQKGRVILFFGIVRKYKGLDILIRAMPSVLAKMDVRLIVCGEFYEDRQEYFELAADLGIQENIRFEDRFVPNEKVGLYFSAADLVVLPYISATQSGIVQLAYYYNKPVIVTDVGGLAEPVSNDKTGYVVPPESPVALARAIVQFYRDKKERIFTAKIKKEKTLYADDHLIEAIDFLYTECR